MSRRDIYYWKCDRPAAFHGTGPRPRADEVPEEAIREALVDVFHPDHLTLSPAAGQGNHLTWNAEIDGAPAFLRIENGPEGDDHLEMESAVLGEVAKAGVPVPRVLGCDASRTRVPFAWQALERIPLPDLNQWAKAGTLDASARWPSISGKTWRAGRRSVPHGFGPFDLGAWRRASGLVGFHASYPDYFRLRLDEHLDFLVAQGFPEQDQRRRDRRHDRRSFRAAGMGRVASCTRISLSGTCWGRPTRVVAFIDFDDAISGDPMDDLSLLACFHDAAFLGAGLRGL